MHSSTNLLAEKQSKPVAFPKHKASSTQTSQLDGTFLTEIQTAKATSTDGCTLHWQQRIFRLYADHLTTTATTQSHADSTC